MKTKLKIVLASAIICGAVGSAFAVGEQTISDAKTRLDGVGRLIKTKGIAAASFVRGTGEEAGLSKHQATQDGLEFSAVTKSNDPEAFLACVADGKWLFHTGTPDLAGKDATHWVDADGMNMFEKCKLAKNNGGYTSINYTKTVNGVNNEKGEQLKEKGSLLVGHSKTLLHEEKNTMGKKFMCFTAYKNN